MKMFYKRSMDDNYARVEFLTDAVNAAIRHYKLSDYCIVNVTQPAVHCVHIGTGRELWRLDNVSKNYAKSAYEHNIGVVNAWLHDLMLPIVAKTIDAKVSDGGKDRAEEAIIPPFTTYAEFVKTMSVHNGSQQQRLAIKYALWEAAARHPIPLPKELLGEDPW